MFIKIFDHSMPLIVCPIVWKQFAVFAPSFQDGGKHKACDATNSDFTSQYLSVRQAVWPAHYLPLELANLTSNVDNFLLFDFWHKLFLTLLTFAILDAIKPTWGEDWRRIWYNHIRTGQIGVCEAVDGARDPGVAFCSQLLYSYKGDNTNYNMYLY